MVAIPLDKINYNKVSKYANVLIFNPRGDAGGLNREYVLRIPSVSQKATKWGAVIYILSRRYGVKE